MTGFPTPDDVVAATATLTVLRCRNDESPEWDATAVPTTWTAARTVEHVADSLVFYAGQVARRAQRRLPVLRDGRQALPGEQVDDVVTAAHLLAASLRDLGDGRAFHPSGLADVAGWAGMAVTEILVHAHDAARALQVELLLPPDLCSRTVARVFPWAAQVPAAPADVLLAVTGRAEVPDVPADRDWWWQSAPLDEWDGRPRHRSSPPGWT